MDLNQVTLPATDLKRSVRFYEALGLTLIVDSVPRYARFEFPDGDSTLSLHHVETVTPGDTLLYFECDDLDEHVKRLQAAGILFDQEPTDERWLWREARLNDPDGNRLCLFYAGENRRRPPWRVEG